jgi:hypothetical protein
VRRVARGEAVGIRDRDANVAPKAHRITFKAGRGR